jgi:tripartite ATP-independent transporter DctM subunit
MAHLLLGIFAIALVIGLPVSICMGMAGMFAVLIDGRFPAMVVPQYLFNGISSFPLMAVPFFILAAEIMTEAGLTASLLKFANDLVGHIRGGLGHVNVLVSMLFAGISGSALADAAGPSAIVMRLMHKAGYHRDYAGALSAATATIGPIIPPSILMVVYAISDNRVTVAGLFLAGVVPGILLGAALMITNHYISIKRGYLFRSQRPTIVKLIASFWKALPALLLPIIIIGGILGGIFTPTEAAAVACAYALVVGLLITRGLKPKDVPGIFVRSGIVTASVLLIVSMASIFAWLLTVLQIPQSIAIMIANFTESQAMVLFILAVFVLMCGLVIDTLPALIILVPILGPVADQFGINPMHFAIMIVLNLTIGMITPPVGPVLFVVSTVGQIRVERLARAIIPMLIAELIVLALVVMFPFLSTAVPNFFGLTH